jgi:hypothetical protein
MRERIGLYMVLVRKPKGKSYLGDPGVDRRIILKWILRKWFGGHGQIDLD